MDIAPTPSSFRRLLQRVEDDPAGNIPKEGLVAACDQPLRKFEQAAGLAVNRIRGVVDARREVEAGAWNDAAVGRIRTVLRRLDDAHKVLDGDTLPPAAVEAMREGLKELDEERQSADPLAATTREVLGRLEAADLPLPVLTRALDEIRMSQSGGREAAAVLLERLRLVLDLPWTARAGERVDIEAAMAELDAAHAGRAALKERVRRFLATRQLTSTTWTLEGLSHGDRCRGGDGSAPAALRRLVVRSARSAARAPVLCFVGPPGGGKTTLAKLIARALGRPGVLVALGGVWDESAVRGLPISFRSPQAGRVVLGLRKAKVRNPVMILDEVDKVGGATTNFGDPSAALLEVLDPAQNTRTSATPTSRRRSTCRRCCSSPPRTTRRRSPPRFGTGSRSSRRRGTRTTRRSTSCGASCGESSSRSTGWPAVSGPGPRRRRTGGRRRRLPARRRPAGGSPWRCSMESRRPRRRRPRPRRARPGRGRRAGSR